MCVTIFNDKTPQCSAKANVVLFYCSLLDNITKIILNKVIFIPIEITKETIRYVKKSNI